MSKHTPGPWKDCIQPGQFGSIRTINSKTQRIATLIHHGIEETEANAKLIAAAPELYDALKEAIKHLEETDFDVCGTPDSLMNKWKTIIQKAEI